MDISYYNEWHFCAEYITLSSNENKLRIKLKNNGESSSVNLRIVK